LISGNGCRDKKEKVMDSSTLSANAASIARIVAGIVGGILTSSGINTDNGTLETVIGSVLIAAAGIWAIVKNAKDAKAAKGA